jgi:hypothetical protein
VRVVSEFGGHPGAEDHAEAGLAQVDLNVRVPAKTLLRLVFQHSGLVDHLGGHRQQRGHGGGVGRHHVWPGGQLFAA